MPARSTLKNQDENVVAGWPCCSRRWTSAGVGRRLEDTSTRKAMSAISPTSSTPPANHDWKPTAARLQKATGVQLALVTIPSLQGEPIEDVANTIARAWGVGQKGQNEGILLLLAISDRRKPAGDRLRPGTDPARRPGRIDSARNAARSAPAALRRGADGRGRDARLHDRQGKGRIIGYFAAAARSAHGVRFHPVAAGDRRNLLLIWLVRAARRPRRLRRTPRRRRIPAGNDPGQYDEPRTAGAAGEAADSAATIPATASAASAAAISAAAAPPATGEDHGKRADPTRRKVAEGLRGAARLGGAVRLGRYRRAPSRLLRFQHSLRADRDRHRANWRRRGDLPLVARAGQPGAAAADRARIGRRQRLLSPSSSTISGENHRLLFGKDVISTLVDRGIVLPRAGGARTARQTAAPAPKGRGMFSEADLLRRMLVDSLSTFCVLFRHALALGGYPAPLKKREIIQGARGAFRHRRRAVRKTAGRSRRAHQAARIASRPVCWHPI